MGEGSLQRRAKRLQVGSAKAAQWQGTDGSHPSSRPPLAPSGVSSRAAATEGRTEHGGVIVSKGVGQDR